MTDYSKWIVFNKNVCSRTIKELTLCRHEAQALLEKLSTFPGGIALYQEIGIVSTFAVALNMVEAASKGIQSFLDVQEFYYYKMTQPYDLFSVKLASNWSDNIIYGSEASIATAAQLGNRNTDNVCYADGKTGKHHFIIDKATEVESDEVHEWSLGDIFQWKMPFFGSSNYIFQFKKQWVHGYRKAIKEAARIYNIPEELLAGVAHNEVGGDPLEADDFAFGVSSFDHVGDPWLEPLTITKKPDLVSFGNVSMQVRRAAETLGYDPSNLKDVERAAIIESLKDPKQNIFIAAAHLAELRDKDFKGKSAQELTEEEIKVIATRYNRGPDLSLDKIREDMSYGNAIYSNIEDIKNALSDN